jgi:hypothetical protein
MVKIYGIAARPSPLQLSTMVVIKSADPGESCCFDGRTSSLSYLFALARLRVVVVVVDGSRADGSVRAQTLLMLDNFTSGGNRVGACLIKKSCVRRTFCRQEVPVYTNSDFLCRSISRDQGSML